MGRKNQHMDQSVYEKIIAEGAGLVEFMWLHLFGEPLLNPNIYQMIDMAENVGIRVGLSTNCTKLTEQASESILKSQLSLLILCLDGISKETFEAVRIGADFATVFSNIERFARMRRRIQTRLKTVLQMIDLRLNIAEQQLFRRQWEDAGFDVVSVKPFHTWANQNQALITLGPNNTLGFRKSDEACFEPWIGMTVLADGTVVPCCNDYAGRQPLGDIKSQSMSEIWNGGPVKALRRILADSKADRRSTICHQCSFPWATYIDSVLGHGPFDPVRSQYGGYLSVGDRMAPILPGIKRIVTITADVTDTPKPGALFECRVRMRNWSSVSLRSTGENAIHLSYHWLEGRSGSIVFFEGLRTALIPEALAESEMTYFMKVCAPSAPGRYVLQLCLVQEGIHWFDDRDNSVFIELDLTRNTEMVESLDKSVK
jgi:hypothetical protein